MSSPAQAAAPARANQQQRRRRQQQQQGESQSAAVPRVAGLARRGLRGVRSLPRNPAEAIARAEERARGLDGPGGGSSKAESCREAKGARAAQGSGWRAQEWEGCLWASHCS
jgi:hypothetical protein